MTVPRKYPNHDDIPATMREWYIQADDGSWILDVEGESPQDIAKLRRIVDQEREQRRRATERTAQLEEQFKDIDPEKYKEALEKLQELEEERQQSGPEAGKKAEDLEKQIARKYERQIAELRNQSQAFQDIIKDREAKMAVIRNRYAKVAIEDQLAKAALEAGADPKKIKFLIAEARQTWQLNEEDEPVPLDGDGNILYGTDPTQVLSMGEHVRSLLKDYPFFALESSGGGTQQRSPNGGTPIGGRIVLTPEQAKDPRQYQAAKAQAEKIGGYVDLSS